MPRITDKFIREMATPNSGQKIERDTLVTGFGVRKTASGHTAFVFSYACHGRDRRMTIGEYPAWSVVAARQAAAKLRMRVDAGEDPLDEQQIARAEYTVQQLWERYDQAVLSRKAESTQRDMRSIWKRLILPALGRRRLSQVKPFDIEKLHGEISAKTPVQANRCVASIRHAFNKAIFWRLVSFNPAVGIEKNDEQPRHRYLDDLERRSFLVALDARPDTASTLAIRFLLLTGARKGEVLKAQWDQVDFEQEAWIKPSSHTKQRRLHRVPLSKGAMDVLRRAQAISQGPIVFPGPTGKSLNDIRKVFGAICEEAGITELRLHDLRHSFASALVSRGTSLPIIGGLLGHTQVSTTARYSHLDDSAMRAATNLLSSASDEVGSLGRTANPSIPNPLLANSSSPCSARLPPSRGSYPGRGRQKAWPLHEQPGNTGEGHLRRGVRHPRCWSFDAPGWVHRRLPPGSR
jgi:integrase